MIFMCYMMLHDVTWLCFTLHWLRRRGYVELWEVVRNELLLCVLSLLYMCVFDSACDCDTQV